MRRIPRLLFVIALLAGPPMMASARQDAPSAPASGREVDRLRSEVRSLQNEVRRLRNQRSQSIIERGDSGTGIALFVCGAFCALWAQNTGRNPWLWFFAGFLVFFVTLPVLLIKNAQDGVPKRPPPDLS